MKAARNGCVIYGNCNTHLKEAALMPSSGISPLRHFLFAMLLSLIFAIPVSLIRADDTQINTPTTAPTNPNAATQPSDLELDKYGWPKDAQEACHRMMKLGPAIWSYARNHEGRYPSDFGFMFDHFKTHREAAECCLTPGDQRRLNIPDHPSADWVNRNASYVFLAANANSNKIAVWGAVVMLHTRLDQPFQHPKIGDVIILTFIDGHTDLFPVAEASKIIEASKKTIAASRGSP
jgi:hypothetical protein